MTEVTPLNFLLLTVAGLVYPSVPKTEGLRGEIEGALAEEFISLLWFDDPPPADAPTGKAWRALQSGELVTDDLEGSPEWAEYLERIRGM